MKQKLTLLLLLCHLFAFAQWTEKSPLPADALGRHHPITFTLNGEGYVVGGASFTKGYLSDAYRYNAASNTWTKLADFPGPLRGYSYGVAYEGKAYLGFGYGNGNFSLSDLWVYDPATDKWTELAPCPCDGRGHPAFIAANGHIFMGLGDNQVSNMNDFWAYNIASNTWAKKKDFPSHKRHHPFYFNIGNDVYVGFGHGSVTVENVKIYRDFYRYDLATDNWVKFTDFPGEARVAGTQFSHNGKGYVLHGDGRTHQFMATGEFWEYTPATDTWLQLPPAPGTSRWAPGSFVIGNTAYAFGGSVVDAAGTYVDMKDTWSYSFAPPSSTWSPAPTEIRVFPNPAQNTLLILAEEHVDLSAEAEAQIINAEGQLCLIAQNPANGIDIQSLTSGVYCLRIKTKHAVLQARFVKA